MHTNGAATATNINGAGQTGSSITVNAVAGGTLAAGTVITLPGVYAVNPQSRVSTGVLAQFVVWRTCGSVHVDPGSLRQSSRLAAIPERQWRRR